MHWHPPKNNKKNLKLLPFRPTSLSTLIGNVTNINSKHHLKRILWLNQQRETEAGGGVMGPAKRKHDGMEIEGKRKALPLGLGPRRGLEVYTDSLILGELLPN